MSTPVREAEHRKRIHLAAHFPGVNNTTVWSDPGAGSQTDFASFVHLARTAERGLFDFFFLAEGLRLREHLGRIYDLDVVGRPDNFTMLAALAAVTDRLGLVATINTTFNEPFEVARQFATLDHLSGGRAGWNMVTSSDAFTGANFRRGGFLAYTERYRRADEFLTVAQRFWDGWPADAMTSEPERGHPVSFRGEHFDVTGLASVPTSPQGRPVLLQAGDSAEGRDFGARRADAFFTLHTALAAGCQYYADVKTRVAAYGRNPDRVKVFPAVGCVLGSTPAEAADRAAHIRRQQVSGPTAIAMLEQVWQRDLSDCDPDGPVPNACPIDDPTVTQGRVSRGNATSVAAAWRDRAAAEGLSIRELAIAMTERHQFVGTPEQVASDIDRHVQSDACDGFILVPHLTPHGLDEFVDLVVPLLQERGVFRTEYAGATLREHLGLM